MAKRQPVVGEKGWEGHPVPARISVSDHDGCSRARVTHDASPISQKFLSAEFQQIRFVFSCIAPMLSEQTEIPEKTMRDLHLTITDDQFEQLEKAARDAGVTFEEMVLRALDLPVIAATAITDGAAREARIETLLASMVDLLVDRVAETIKLADLLRSNASQR